MLHPHFLAELVTGCASAYDHALCSRIDKELDVLRVTHLAEGNLVDADAILFQIDADHRIGEAVIQWWTPPFPAWL